jgi:hypothetical protein
LFTEESFSTGAAETESAKAKTALWMADLIVAAENCVLLDVELRASLWRVTRDPINGVQ